MQQTHSEANFSIEMKKLQKFLDLIFPHEYAITDTWDEKNDDYDVYGIYMIPLHKRSLELTECLQELQKYSPEFVIFILEGKWYFQYTVTYPGTRDDPPYSDYVEYNENYTSSKSAMVGLVKWIVEDLANDFFLTEQTFIHE